MSATDPARLARAQCLRWLAQREQQSGELRSRLLLKGFDEAVVEATLERLREEGLQSDRRFLDAVVRNGLAKGHGPRRIYMDLRLQGLGGDEVDDYLAQHETWAGCDWEALLDAVYEKKFGGAAPATQKDYAARARYLSQRGFAADRIQALLRRLPPGDEQPFLEAETIP